MAKTKHKALQVRRRVVHVTRVLYHGSRGSNYLLLSCRHVKRQKTSIRIPKVARCRECEYAAQKENRHDD